MNQKQYLAMIRKMFMMSIVFLFTMLAGSCQQNGISRERMIKDAVSSFVGTYYNWQFLKACDFVTPESEKRLRFVASQVDESDLKQLKEKEAPASFEIESIEINADSTATAVVTVSDFLRMGKLGEPAILTSQATVRLHLLFDAKQQRWLVDINN